MGDPFSWGRLVLTALAAAAVAACGSSPSPTAADPVVDLSHAPLPEWTDRYSADPGEARFFNISKLMEVYGLDRLDAVELQNLYRDLTRADPPTDAAARKKAFDQALAMVAAGERESGLRREVLESATFIVVVDLDDTLYDQHSASEGCHDLAFDKPGGGRQFIKLVPGWERLLETVNQLGGVVVLFSANLDEATLGNLAHWRYQGQPLHQHPKVAGLMTNSYLVQQSTHEGPGQENPRRGFPVVAPSKDLRIVDPTLSKAIIVDDNLGRLFQMRNTRIFKKFRADQYCADPEPQVREAHARGLLAVTEEIAESARYMGDHKVGFVQAYLPYSVLGRITVDWLMAAHSWDFAAAAAFVRRHPEVVDQQF